MSKKTISFVSTRGRGLNTDLQLVKDNLMAALPEVDVYKRQLLFLVVSDDV